MLLQRRLNSRGACLMYNLSSVVLKGIFVFQSFETVKRVHITNEPFTADNVLTATFKIKRFVPSFKMLSFYWNII